MADIAKVYVQIVPTTKGISEGIKSALGDGKQAGEGFGSKMASGISSALKAGTAVIGAGLASAAAGVTALSKQALDSFADYEQLTGGVETLFGTSAQSLQEYVASVGGATADNIGEIQAKYMSLQTAQSTVMENAAIAYKTAGLSANEYMETVTGFSAALISSVGGDTEKAAKLADQAIIDMSDNANKMGSSMESIQGWHTDNYPRQLSGI